MVVLFKIEDVQIVGMCEAVESERQIVEFATVRKNIYPILLER